ncbi:hypothetical protein AGOR_G00011590 [Albula goreensis]|uniref:Coiled-coil domain-containing protein 74B n=1 Tax=Albula goreensis TaxID=1534307 RepID=A0A8T3E9P0_9TELE|nr:hypothetical protein AGOR_G00011590 [Albula goreensis]
MSSFSVPPLGNLPHWSRAGSLHKAHVPRSLPRDRLQPLPNPPRVDDQANCEQSDMDTRVASLERDIHFLQEQHKDTLQKLHFELDSLKRENKELQYKLIMDPPHSYRKGSSRAGHHPHLQPEPQPQQGVSQEQHQHVSSHSKEAVLRSENTVALSRSDPEPPKEVKGGLITSLQPLRIHCSPSQPPRAPTLQECEVIIRQLYNANSLQSQELLRVKAVLKDIVFNRKITPETYIMTKAYLAENTSRTGAVERFPKLPIKPLPKRLEGSRMGVAERVILPALKQSLGSSMVERQKRAQAVQRSRLRRTVH